MIIQLKYGFVVCSSHTAFVYKIITIWIIEDVKVGIPLMGMIMHTSFIIMTLIVQFYKFIKTCARTSKIPSIS